MFGSCRETQGVSTTRPQSNGALLAGAPSVDLTGQGQYDVILGTAHLGILNSPAAWDAALRFLRRE